MSELRDAYTVGMKSARVRVNLNPGGGRRPSRVERRLRRVISAVWAGSGRWQCG